MRKPNALRRLLTTACIVHHFEPGAEHQVQQGRFATALAADDGHTFVVAAESGEVVGFYEICEFSFVKSQLVCDYLHVLVVVHF